MHFHELLSILNAILRIYLKLSDVIGRIFKTAANFSFFMCSIKKKVNLILQLKLLLLTNGAKKN